MPSQGPNAPSTGANDAAVGTVAWTNPGNVTADDSTFATAALTAIDTTQFLKATGFGFSIPTGSTVDGILVEWKRKGEFGVDNVVKLVQGGAVAGDDKADAVTAWPNPAAAYASYGGAADLWGLTWTPAQINAADFGAVLSGECTDVATLSVDHVRITVTYTPPPATPPVSRWGRPPFHPGFADE